MDGTNTRTLILAAHGSMATVDANQPLLDLADRISQHGQFDAVMPAFLNGQPNMTDVLEQLANLKNIPGGDVVIVPAMTSEGYYLKKLPEKFAENGNANDYRIAITPVVGVHPSIPRRIQTRIESLLGQFELNPADTTVALIGHGTRRNPNSGAATLKLANSLKEQMQLSGLKFETGFIDQAPSAESIAAKIQTQNTLVMPFLISRGPHTTIDVPEAFGLSLQPGFEFPLACEIADRFFVYDFPLALYPGLDELCVEMAIEQLAVGTPLTLPQAAPGTRDEKLTATGIADGGLQ